MRCLPCFFSRQVRFEREFESRVRALHAAREAQPLSNVEPLQPFADLRREGAAQATAAAAHMPVPRAPSMDFIKFDQDLLAWQDSGPPGQRVHRQRAARQLRTAKRMRETSLTLEHLELDDLPACLASMNSLTELCVRQCRIGQFQALPPRLEALDAIGVGLRHLPPLPDSLIDLTIHHNLLETLPKLPDHLHTLSASYNRLRILPALPASLFSLYVADNRLTELPPLPLALKSLNASNNLLESIPEIPVTTSNVGLHCNRLTDLPRSITAMDVLEWVAVYDNPLPANVLERIGLEILQRTDDAVMYLNFEGDHRGYSVLEASPPPYLSTRQQPLLEQVMAWYDQLPSHDSQRSDRMENWEIAYCRGLGATEYHPATSFVRFLNRVYETADYRDLRLRPELTARVCRLLDRLPENDGLREQCYALATDALGECQDRIAAGLAQMELCVLNADATDGALNSRQIQTLGIGMLKLEELQTICAELSAGNRRIDEIELHLALRTQFAAALNLPSVSIKMHYDPPSQITADQWIAAQERVKTVASDPERRIAFLARWGPWQASLQRQALPPLIAAFDEKSKQEQRLQGELDALMDQLMGLPPALGEFSESYFNLHADIARTNLAFNRLDQQLVDPVRLMLTRQLIYRESESATGTAKIQVGEAN